MYFGSILHKYNGFKLFVSGVIVSQKVSNGDGKLQFFGGTIILLAFFVHEYIFGQRYILHWKKIEQNER